jgi:hypothetical protein
MTRTTLALKDDVLRRLKHRAAERATTVQVIANEILEEGLLARARNAGFRLRLPKPWQAKAAAGVDITDRDRLFDLLERG